ncbi:MAG: hypothetical protein JRI25_12375 [Deltaproteobacteria bacterium]|nr:hypothetical protein [Deltaproteobacteria bacterium]MBW2255377.1 hypothetical protein [Deltaproteobacteria bacterium]
MNNHSFLLLLPLLATIASACSTNPAPAEEADVVSSTEEPVTVPHDDAEAFEAKLTVDPEPGYKHFQGVWLEREDGDRWVIDYRARDCWTPFDGHRVRVVGEQYQPEGQAIGAIHFRVETLEVLDPMSMTSLVSVGPEKALTGRMARVSGEPGTKMEGSSYLVFTASDGTGYQLINPTAVSDHVGTQVSITARPVERSPYSTHMPGPTLWIKATR